jgi:hypothetical protein
MERIKTYVKLYFQEIFPLCIGIAALTLVILLLIGRLNFVNYLNTLFIEAAVALIVAGIFSILSFFNLKFYKYFSHNVAEFNLRLSQMDLLDKEAKNKTIDERVNTSKVRFEASVYCLIIGATLLLLLFMIHFGSRFFI